MKVGRTHICKANRAYSNRKHSLFGESEALLFSINPYLERFMPGWLVTEEENIYQDSEMRSTRILRGRMGTYRLSSRHQSLRQHCCEDLILDRFDY